MNKILESSVQAVEDVLAYLSRYMIGKDMTGYCELSTALGLTEDDVRRKPSLTDPYIVVTDEGSLLTVFDVQGTFQILADEEFHQMVDNLRVKMNGYLRRPGHSLTFSFERDPDRSHDELMRLAAPQIAAARRMGLKTEDLILERVRRNAPFVAWEQNLLVVYTHLSVMAKDEKRQEIQELSKDIVKHKLPRIELGQNPAAVVTALKHRHDTMVERIKFDFQQCGNNGRPGIMMRPISAHEAIKRIRIMVNRERTAQTFRPSLPGDKITPRGREVKGDSSDLALPLVRYQICSNNVESDGGFIKTDELWHGNMSMELGPQEPQTFAQLFASMDRGIPWRIRFDLAPGGLDQMKARRMLVSFVGLLPSNHQIRQSFLDLAQRAKEDTICSMKVTASTWASSKSEVKRRMASLEKAIQSWGICQVTSVHGDPMAAWASTIPGFTTKNVAVRMVPPLQEAMDLMPLQRPATPWSDGGSLVMRTPDGKIYPIQLGSRLQDTWLDAISATPGSGKSFLLNTMDMATIHSAGNTRLPLMTMIDVGASSEGKIELIRDSLPEERKSEAVYIRLRNSRDQFGVCVFDTQLGARFPTGRERDFLVDFLTLLCTDASKRRAPGDCARVNDMLLKIAYEDRAVRCPHPYEQGVEKEIDQLLAASGLKDKHDATWWSSATWYEVTDMLFEAGHIREAAIAQRQAVPVLTDFPAYLNNESVRQLFGESPIDTGENILSYMNRCFTVATSTYSLFAGRTTYELDSQTRIVSLDLNDVIGPKTAEGSLRTAVMYMYARQLAAKNYFLDEEQILEVIPPMYRDFHLKRVADIKDEKKTIGYDELHNTQGQDSMVQTLIKDAREGRKTGIRIVAASQYLKDYPEELLNAATSVYVMRGGSVSDEKILRDTFNVSNETIRRLQMEAVGPGPEGGNFLAIFKTKIGYVHQMLTNTVSPVETWAFSSTAEDVALRKRLYKRIGNYAARRMLAESFPEGTATGAIEQMKANSRAEDHGSAIDRLADQLVAAYIKSIDQKGLMS